MGPLEENTVYKAWALLWEASGHELPARIRLHKKIPAGAGLGGSSADAAAVLVGMNELFDLGLEIEDLRRLGARIRADVPFCLSGGTLWVKGGRSRRCLRSAAHYLLLAKPDRSADTGGIYRAHDRRGAPGEASAEPVVAALRSGSLAALAGAVSRPRARYHGSGTGGGGVQARDAANRGARGRNDGHWHGGLRDLRRRECNGRYSLLAPFVSVCKPVGSGVLMV